jgi:hypothetical protein
LPDDEVDVLLTKIIRVLTNGPYSHVELQFTQWPRVLCFWSRRIRRAQLIRDHKVYNPSWDPILIPATQEQEDSAQRFAFGLVGIPFDFRGLFRFLFPGRSRRRGRYCSALILDVLQNGLHMFPNANLWCRPMAFTGFFFPINTRSFRILCRMAP